MIVWLTIPSARPAAEAQACIDKWRAMGYMTAIQRDTGTDPVDCDYLVMKPWEGYAKACNGLIKDVMEMDADAQWFVLGGDDTDPDPNKRADVIARECGNYFGGCPRLATVDLGVPKDTPGLYPPSAYETFGVMQPTGDRYAGGSIDRIAGSPWIGREFCERAYGGNGPLWSEYRHMFEDEELREVAMMLGVYWMRPDLTHLHRHFMRASLDINSAAVSKPIPPHLAEANSAAHWNKFKALYERRKAAGFPGHEVLRAVAA